MIKQELVRTKMYLKRMKKRRRVHLKKMMVLNPIMLHLKNQRLQQAKINQEVIMLIKKSQMKMMLQKKQIKKMILKEKIQVRAKTTTTVIPKKSKKQTQTVRNVQFQIPCRLKEHFP